MEQFTCDVCKKQFARKDSLHRHREGYCMPLSQLCEVCGVKFSSLGHFRKHQVQKHGLRKRKLEDCVQLTPKPKQTRVDNGEISIQGGTTKCDVCDVHVLKKYMMQHCRSLQHKNKTCVVKGNGVTLINQSFKHRIATYRITTGDTKIYVDIKEYMKILKQQCVDCITTTLDKRGAVKINIELFGVFTLQSKNLKEVKSFNTKFKVCTSSTNLNELYNYFIDIIDNKVSEFQERESGWALERLLFIELNINKYSPLRASSYIPLPQTIQNRKAVINIQNVDNRCFMWSVLAALHPVDKHACRITKYTKYENELHFAGIEFPVKLRDIPKFELQNDISINVYSLDSIYENGKVKYEISGPLHFTKTKRDIHVNLLLIDDNEGGSHYCLIKNLSRLVNHQLSTDGHKKSFCDGCLINFTSSERLALHQQHDCKNVRVILPTTEPRLDKFGNTLLQNILKFESFEQKLKLPFVAYVDFESMLVPLQYCQQDSTKPFSQKTHMHTPYSFAYYIKCSYDDSLSKFESYRGFDCAKVFCERMDADIKEIYVNHLKHIVPMNNLTENEKLDHKIAVNCHICEKPFLKNEDRVKDHCHLTGKYRGPAHSICNLNFKLSNFIPIFFHNLSNYDAHLFIKALGLDERKIDVIATNKEKYISFTKHVPVETIVDKNGKEKNVFMKLRFLDSFRFMPMSLEKLAKNLGVEQCTEIKKYFGGDKFSLIRQKGVFPYSYVDSMERLDDPQLPTREQFYNDLTNSEISESDYERAKMVWGVFKCKTLGDYSDIYLKSDVLLLADIFENFRYVCMEAYKLDPCHFYTAPGLSWNAMLKYTEIELELLTDIDMVHFFQKGIRGGLCQCSKRAVKANNPFMSTFNPNKQTSYLAFLDATNLYGASLSVHLPTGGFKWLSDSEIQNFNINEIRNTSNRGYVLEVDLDYPQSLHDLHNELPFCPENISPPNSKYTKLIANLNPKEKYIIHYQNLQQCLNAGLKLRKVHRILSFSQSPWLKKYVDLNTVRRNQAVNEFDKTFYKLMNNAVFGKTMENVDKRVNIRLITHWENIGKRLGAESLISKPNFKNLTIISEDFVAIQMERLKVVYNKPIYIGFCVLDLSKFIMYNFYYNFIKEKYGDRALLTYTDTDSLVLELFTDNFYEDMKKNLEYFDTSNYLPKNRFDMPITKSVIGRMKDEYGGKIIWKFYGTGAKAYIVDVEGEFTKKAKGVQTAIIKNELDMDDYEGVVLHNKTIYKTMRQFRSYNHQLYTEIKNKVALSPEDDKRYIIPGTHMTLAWGHHKIPTC